MRIVGIVGIWDMRPYARVWENLRTAFQERFPDASFEVQHAWYSPWQVSAMRQFSDHLIKQYDTGEEILLVGWSMGGVIATAIASRFRKSRVRGVVTIYSPHRFIGGIFSRMLGSTGKEIPSVPVLSVGARFDWMVWWGAKYPGAVRHLTLCSDHVFGLLCSKKPADLIAEITASTL